MKTARWISLTLVAVPLLAIFWSSFRMIVFVQPERAEIAAGKLDYMFSYENYVHEAGIARLILALIGLLILFIPYRKGERWALAAVCILVLFYEIPVFVFGGLPTLGMWSVFRNLPAPRSVSLNEAAFYSYSIAALSVLGVAVGAPLFQSRKRI